MKVVKYETSDSSNYLTLRQAVTMFNVGETLLDKVAKDCGAKLKIGRAARYRKDLLQAHFDSMKV